ncbi:MAG: citrate/2-methylcitrate synthase [Planctomycetota bacterium]
MDRSALPAAHLIQGLRRLVEDVTRSDQHLKSGLAHVECGETDLISFGDNGIRYCDVAVEDLVSHGSFERVIWLLLNQTLPTEEELADCCSVLSDAAVIDPSVARLLSHLPVSARPLDLFPLCVSLLSFFDPAPQDLNPEATRWRVWRILAQLPLIVSAALGDLDDADQAARGSNAPSCRQGKGCTAKLNSNLPEMIAEDVATFSDDHSAEDDDTTQLPATELSHGESELSWAGRLLYRLRGRRNRPTVAEDQAMNAILICECLTEMRPACFAARFAASTTGHIAASLQSAATIFATQLRNDPFSWISDLLTGFGDPSQAEAWWRRREGQPMPYGFTAATNDNRPRLLREISGRMLGSVDRLRIASVAARLEKILANEHQVPTTDWSAARLMTLLDIPADRQALVIVVARLVGWSAQAIEQQSSGISLLPTLRYGAF